MGKRKAEVRRELGVVIYTAKMVKKNRTKVISACKYNGSRITGFRKPE
jgi:hypothetical protein